MKSRQLTIREQSQIVKSLSGPYIVTDLKLALDIQHGTLFLIADESDAMRLNDLILHPIGASNHD